MAFTDFDFGGDVGFDGGFDTGSDVGNWWEDPVDDQGSWWEDPNQFTEEQALEAIAGAMAEQQGMGEGTPMEDVLAAAGEQQDLPTGEDAAATQPEVPDVVPGVPSEVTPNQVVDDAFFDLGGQPSFEARTDATPQEALKEAFNSQEALQSALQELGIRRAEEPLMPSAPPTTFADRFDAATPRPEGGPPEPGSTELIVPRQVQTAAGTPIDQTAERGRSDTLSLPPAARVGRSIIPPGTSPETIRALNEVAARHGLSPKAIAGVIKTESNWNPNTRSPGRGTYRGLTQIGPENPEYRNLHNMTPAQHIQTYGRWLDRYNFQDKMRNAGIDLSKISPERQAAILQGFQFGPNATSWQMAAGRGNFSVPTTPHPQARSLGDRTIGAMERYYGRMFGGADVPSFSTAMVNEPSPTMLASSTPLPELATDVLPTNVPPVSVATSGDLSDQERLAAAFNDVMGNQLAQATTPNPMAFTPEDVSPEPVDPSTLPEPGARITIRPQRGTETTVEEPGAGPTTELPEILVTPTPEGQPVPPEGGPGYPDQDIPGTAQPGPGQYDTGAEPSGRPGESPADAQQRREIERRRQQQQQAQQPQVPIEGRPRDPGDFTYPITPTEARPQSVLRTDIAPARDPYDIRDLLEQTAKPIDTGALQRPPALPGVAAGQAALQAAQAVGQAAIQTPEDIGHLLNETILNRLLDQDPGGARRQEDRMRGAFTIPAMATGAGIFGTSTAAASPLLRGLGVAGNVGNIFLPPDVGDIVKGQSAVAKMLPSGGIRPGNITADELMSTFSSLSPVSSAMAAARQDTRPNAATRRKIERAKRLQELRARGMTLNERDEEVPLSADEIAAMHASGDVRRALDAGVPMHIIRNLGPSQDPGTNVSAMVLMGGAAGLIAVPFVLQKFKGVLPALPRFKSHTVPVDPVTGRTQAPPTVRDYSAPRDIARASFDDANAAATNAISRIGAPSQAVEAAQRIGWLQTRGQATALTEAAVHTGEMKSVIGDFRVSASLSDLARRIGPRTPDYNRYQIALDTIDDIKLQSMTPANMATGTVPTVRTMDLAQATQVVRQMEAVHPDFPRLNAIYRENLREARKFAAMGEDATLSRVQQRDLTRTRPNEVPMTDKDRRGIEYVDQDNVVKTLADHIRNTLRTRLENTFNGELVRISKRVNSDVFAGPYDKDTYRQMIRENPLWESHSINVPNRGKDQYYFGGRTIIDAMKFDPYGFSSGWGSYANAAARTFQAGTTGVLAPWFATTNMMVTHAQLKFTTQGFGRAPSFLNTLAAVPRQADARLARYMAEALNNNSDHWFRKVFGDQLTDVIGRNMADTWANSWARTVERYGGSTGTWLHSPVDNIRNAQGQWQARFNLGLIPPEHRGWMKTMKDGYMGLLESLHSAPTFAGQVKRMRGSRGAVIDMFRERTPEHPMEAVLGTRIAASDTRITGSRPLRYEGPGQDVARATAVTAEGLRAHTPWMNAIVQGQKRIADAWMQNPAEFTAKLGLYVVAPIAGTYFWNMGLGTDPNGISYVDHQMNRRSEDQKLMRMYIGIPGRPAEEGIDIRFLPHELTVAGRITLGAIHQMYGNPMFTGSEEFSSAAQAYIRNTFSPAAPVWMNGSFAAAGYRNFGGPFMPEIVKQRQDPYDPLGNIPGNLELGTRAIAGGLGEIVGAGAASMVYPEQTVYERLTNSMRSMARRVVEKDAIVSNITGVRPPMSSVTQMGTWVFDKNKEIGNLLAHQTRTGQRISIQPQSGAGSEMVQSLLPQGTTTSQQGSSYEGKTITPAHPIIETRRAAIQAGEPKAFPVMGARVAPPNNPFYHEFIEPLRKFARTDESGYRSAWREHGYATKQIATLRKVPHDNATLWQQELRSDPHALELLSKYNINSKDPKAVMNFFVQYRNDARSIIRGMILGFEEDMTRRALENPALAAQMRARGLNKLTVNDLRPYVEDPEVPEVPGFVPDMGQYDTP